MEDGQGKRSSADETPVVESVYWRHVVRVTVALLVAWLLVTLVGPWFARDLAGWSLFGFPLSFWMASQGALLLYIAIIVVYALLMDRLDERHRDADADAAPPND
jgi:putative solute:sodium symporter small subunit